MKRKISNWLQKVKFKLSMAATAVSMAMFPLTVHAGEIFKENVTVQTNQDGTTLVNNGIGFFIAFARIVGIGVGAYGVIELVTSFLQDMPDKRMKGVTFLLVGIALVVLKNILSAIGFISG